MAVFFQCKSCEGEHRWPAGFVDRQSFEGSPMPEQHLHRVDAGTVFGAWGSRDRTRASAR